MAFERMRVFTGNANPKLAEAVVRHLNVSLGRCIVGRFSDGEVMVELLENVRGRDAFILQSTCAPTNDNLMEILVMVDALKRASAGRITAAIPYFGYARQDRRPRSARVPITAKVVADMLSSVGVNRVMTMDLHADQIQGFFNIPVDNIYATPVLLGDLFHYPRDNANWLIVELLELFQGTILSIWGNHDCNENALGDDDPRQPHPVGHERDPRARDASAAHRERSGHGDRVARRRRGRDPGGSPADRPRSLRCTSPLATR